MKRQILLALALLGGLSVRALADCPGVCSGAYLWLDASRTDTMTVSSGEITEWRSVNGGATAKKYTLTGQYASVTPRGPVFASCQLPTANSQLVSFGGTAANRDLNFPKTTAIRAVFMVAKIEQGGNAFFLGGSDTFDFHRGGSGQFWHSSHGKPKSGKTYVNGVEVTSPTSTLMPDHLCLIDVQSDGALAASQLCYDRQGNGAVPRRGGKDIAEVLVFTNALGAAERRQVRAYLSAKWRLDDSPAWETLPADSALPQTVALGDLSAPWKIQAVFTGVKTRDELAIKNKYPPVVSLTDGTGSLYLSLNGWNNSRDLFLTSSDVLGTQAGTPIGTVNGNNDVGNGEYWSPENRTVTLLLENDGTHLSVSQNGHLFIKTDKNFANGLIRQLTLGAGVEQVGGTLASLKVMRPRTATVVRAHPRLTAGLARESLVGIRMQHGAAGALTNLTVRFDLANCTPDQIADVRVWRQKYDPVPFAFYERDAVDLGPKGLVGTRREEAGAAGGGTLTVDFSATDATDALTVYPRGEDRDEGDYIWVTAKIADDIATNAEIWTSIAGDRLQLSSGAFALANQTAKAPHRPFPYRYHVGAYVRQDRLVGNGKTNWDIFSGYPEERYRNLTDVIAIYSLDVSCKDGAYGFYEWDTALDDTASTWHLVETRDACHPACMVRGSMEGKPFSAAGAGESTREQFAKYVTDFCAAKGLDGMDLDYEWPVSADAGNHTEWQGIGKMMRALAEHFFDAGLVLTLSTRSNDTGMPNSSADYGAFHTADYITSQAYGAGHINAGPTIQRRALAVCTNRGVPSRRVVLGQAIFSCQGQWGWDQAVGPISSYASDRLRRFDLDIVYPASSSYHIFEGPSSYHAQCDWARSANCGGVMSWGYYTDTDWYAWHSLGRHQAQAIWPMPRAWPEPDKDGDTYYLKTEEDWFWLYDHPDAKACLGADITLAHDPLAMQNWTGVLDGTGHTLTIAEDAWVTRGDDTGLIRKLNGTVKNLTINLEGRVYTLAGRWNDNNWEPATARTTNATSGENPVGVLAAEAGDGAVVENVRLVMGPKSEVKGVKYAGGLVGKVTGAATIRNNAVEVGGKVHVEIRNTWDTLFLPTLPAVGAVCGYVADGAGATVEGNSSTVAPGGEIQDLDEIPAAKYALAGAWREPTGWDAALPMEVDVRSSDWALEVVLELPDYTAATLKGGQYPQLVRLVGGDTAFSLSASGDGGGELFLTGDGAASYVYPLSRAAIRSNKDVGSGVKLATGADGRVTLLVESISGELRISQNGETVLVTDKNGANGGYLAKALVGGGIAQLGGGRVVSARLKTDRRDEIVHPEGYGTLVFADEFGGDALDGDNWSRVPDNARNVDWKKYTSSRADLVAVSNGCLVLTGAANDGSDPADTRKFQCGQVQSSGKFNFQYGVVEIRAKFENQSGAWPAMWMMPQNGVHGTWPRSGEIDITERLNDEARVYQTAHFGATDTTAGATAAIRNGEFNVYRFEWTERKLTWYVNGVETHSYSDPGGGYLRWPFDSPFYLILSQQLEGKWVGEVTDPSTLPVRMYVDYVRVWQKDETDAKQNAYLWLDASAAGTVETNAAGEVAAWHSANACGKSARRYALASDSPGAPTLVSTSGLDLNLVSFGDTAANRDLKFDRATDLRTVFMVAKVQQGGNAFLLGDGSAYDFHRGSNGEYWNATYASEGIRGGRTLWNGERVANPTAATMPGELGLVEVHASSGVTASQLCYDRKGNGNAPRRGGKDVAEVLAFREELDETQSAEIRRYLMAKWNVGSAATWTFTESGLEKAGSAAPALLWVMNHAVDAGAVVTNEPSLANLNTVNLTLAEKPVTLGFTNRVATIVAGAETILAETNAANLVIADGKKATLLDGVTMGGYELAAGGTLRHAGDLSSGIGVGAAFVAGGAGTYEFKNVKFTGGLQSDYKVRVTDGDNMVIDGNGNNNGRCKFAFDVRGGRVTFPAGATTWVENATYRQSGGEFVSLATSKNQSGTGDGFMLGFNNSPAMALDISGGLFAVTNSSLNFYNPVTMNIGGSGIVRAKGMFRSNSEATVNVNAGGTLEIGSLGLKAATCVLNLRGGTLKGCEPGAVVHDNVNLLAPSVLASAPGASLAIDGNLYYSGAVTLAAGSTLTLPSGGALTFGLVTDCADVKVTEGVLDFGTTRGAELNALSGKGTIRITLTGDERKTAKDGIRLFKWSGGDYAGDVTVVPNVGGEALLALKDGYLVFTPAIVALKATVSGVTNWCDIVWTDDLGNREIGSAVTNYAAQLTAAAGAVVRVRPADDVNAISMALSGKVTILGENLAYLPWSGTEVGGTVVYAGRYDLGDGTAGFGANGTYEFAADCTITANKFMTGNAYDVVQTFNQLGGLVSVTNDGAGTATGSAPAIFAHWGGGRPSTVVYNVLGGEFVATNSSRYALYFGADGKPTLNIGGGETPARMMLSGLAQGTDSSARTQPGEISVKPNGTLTIGSGGIYLRNANTAFNLAGGTLKFTENGSVTINHANRVNLSADSTVEVAAGKNVAFAHPWTGSGKLSLAGGGSISMSIDIPSKNVHDGIAVDIAKVAADFPASKCRIYFTCDEYEGLRDAAKVEVVNGVLRATPKVDASVWVQTDSINNANHVFTAMQYQGSFYRGKGEYQPLIGVKIDKLQHAGMRHISATLSAGTDPNVIADCKLFTTSTPYFTTDATELTATDMVKTVPSGSNRTIKFDFWSSKGSLKNITVGNYLWIGVTLKAAAPAHAEIDAKISGIVMNGFQSTVYNVDPKGAGEVYPYEYHVVPYWRLGNWTLLALTRQHFACYTEMIPFYVTVNANGSVGHGWNGEQFTDAKFQAAIDKIKSLRAGKDVKLLVGVGMSQGNLPTVCANETLRKTAAQNLAAFVKKFGLDGVDFDWEYPTTKAHWEGWCNLVADLKPLLFKQGGGKLVSVAVTGWKTQQAGTTLGAGDAVKGLYQQCDFVNMMSYDGSEAAGHSTLALMNNDFTRAATYGGLPNYRICGGQAFYTNHYPCDGSQNGFNWVVNNYPQYVDSVDKFTASDGKVYTYNSLATIRAKCARCREIGGGAMVWANETDVALSHEKSATRAMFSQIYPSRGSAADGTLEVTQAADWPAVVSVGAATLAADITLDAGTLRPAVFKGTLDGKGHTITVTDTAPIITSNSGTLKNVTVRYANGINLIYDANGNAVRSCEYPNALDAPVTLAEPYAVDFAASQRVTVGAMVNIPEGANGDVVNLVDGGYRIWLRAVPDGTGRSMLRLGWTNTDGTLNYRDGGIRVTTGPHAVSVTCSATKGEGTRVCVDGEWAATDSTLNFSSASFSRVCFGSAGMGLYACDAISGYRGAFVYPFGASYPEFNVVAIHADNDPLELTDLSSYASNAVATVFASVASPVFEAARPVLDFTVKGRDGNVYAVEAFREGETTARVGWRYAGGEARTFASQTVTARETLGHRVWHMSYDAGGGTYLDLNGKSAAASSATKWSGSQVDGIALGLAAGSEVRERRWLVGEARAADPAEPLGGLVAPPAWFAGVGSAAQDYLFACLGTDIETYEIPAITVNGASASTNDALLAMRYFAGDPNEPADYTLALDAPVVGADGVTLALAGDQPVNAALQLLAKAARANGWSVAAEIPAGSPERAFSFPLDVDGHFYALRANEAVSSKARGDMPLVSSSVSQIDLGSVSFNPEPSTLTVSLAGAGVTEGMTGYVTLDGVAYVARVDAGGKLNFSNLLNHLNLLNPLNLQLTLVVPKGAANGDIHVAGSSTRALVTEIVADNLYRDGFTTKDFGSYRIPSLVTDGAGEVLCLYDVRYGGGDLGTGDGIDIGETYSADFGETFERPYLAIDVPNKREKDQSQRSGWSNDWDIGDVSTLYDPVTEKYWLMGITGQGLNPGNHTKNDVVMYVRGKGAGKLRWEGRTSVKDMIANQPGVKTSSGGLGFGFLAGPGHGFVTTMDVVYTNGTAECTMPAGTLVFPMQYFVDGSFNTSTVGALYSTDHGTNWVATTRSATTDAPQENCVMELDDGSWYMTAKAGSRNGSNPYAETGKFKFFRSKDYRTWTAAGVYAPVPCQQGSCLKLGRNKSDGKGRYVLCHTLDRGGGIRAKVALVFGVDTTADADGAAGISWDFANPVMLYYDNTGFKGYNSLCMVDETTLGVLYEAQNKIYFIRIDVSDRLR